MARPKGLPKTGGRKMGTPNRSTIELKLLFDNRGFDPVDDLIDLMPILEPSQRAKICLDLLSYLYPKRKTVDIQHESETKEDCPRCSRFRQMTSEERQEQIKFLARRLEAIGESSTSID